MSSVLTRRRTTTLLAAGLLPFALTACGSGLHAETYQERTVEDASNHDLGPLALRDVGIEPPPDAQLNLPAGSDATVHLAIANSVTQADQLVQVTTPAAASAELVDRTGATATSIPVPPAGLVTPSDFSVRLKGLTQAVMPGMYVDMTFVFQNAGRATFQVPVRVYPSPIPRPVESASSSSEH